MKSEKLQFDRSLATDSEATYRLRTKSHLCLDAGIGGTFYSIPVDSYRNFRRILLYAAMRTISSVDLQDGQRRDSLARSPFSVESGLSQAACLLAGRRALAQALAALPC